MKTSLFEVLRDIVDEKRSYFENRLRYARKIKETCRKNFPDVRVLLFGSSVRGTFNPSGDIDVLVISSSLPSEELERTRLKVELKRVVGIFSPFQLHLATPEEWEGWYRKFIKDEFLEV